MGRLGRRTTFASTVITLALVSCAPGGSGSAGPEPDRSARPDAAAATLLAMLPDGLGQAVVSLEPLAEAASVASEPAPELAPELAPAIVIEQFARTFYPRMVIAATGQQVRFGNGDDTEHNVRVTRTQTQAVVINVDLMHDDEIEHRFGQTGTYSVRCDMHPGMMALVLVVSHPYAAIANDRGSFRVEEIPAGSYLLTAWGVEGARILQRQVQVRADANGDLAMSSIASDQQ